MRSLWAALFILIVVLPYGLHRITDARKDTAVTGRTEVLTVLSPHRREVKQEYSRAFSKWMQTQWGRTVRIQWLDVGGTSKILKELESRYASRPNDPGADILFGGGLDPYLIAQEHEWLAHTPLPAETLEAIPAKCAGLPTYDPGQRWFGVALSSFGIVYNRRVLARLRLAEPTSWDDLGRPEYFTWVASGDPRSSGSVHMCYEIILQARGFESGWSLITRLCANVRRFGEGGGTAPNEVAAGEVAAGMAIDQYAQTVMDLVGRDTVGFVLPAGATVISADPIALLRNAPEPDLGRRFIEFVLSEPGQRVLFQPAGINEQRYALHRMPVRRSLYNASDGPSVCPYDQHQSFGYDARKGNQRRRILSDLIGACLIDAHVDLQAAWASVIRGGGDPDTVRQLCAPPVTEADLTTLAREWHHSRRRLATMTRWAENAITRYRAIARGRFPSAVHGHGETQQP